MTSPAPTVTISGSYHKHMERILIAKRQFEQLGAVVLRPRTERIVSPEGALVRLEGDPLNVREVQLLQLEAIAASDLVYVVNPGGHVGASATLEVGDAWRGRAYRDGRTRFRRGGGRGRQRRRRPRGSSSAVGSTSSPMTPWASAAASPCLMLR